MYLLFIYSFHFILAGFINTLALFQSNELRFKLSWLMGLITVAAALAIPSVTREHLFTHDSSKHAPFLEASEAAYAIGGFLVGFGTVSELAPIFGRFRAPSNLSSLQSNV